MSIPLTAQVLSSYYPRGTLMPARARPGKVGPWRAWSMAGCLGLATAGASWGADLPFGDEARASLQQEQASFAAAYEVNSTVLPAAGDAAATWPAWATGQPGTGFNSTQHVDVTRWLTPESPEGHGRFGLSMGMSAPAPFAGAGPGAASMGGPASLDLGVRWRSRLDSGRHVDVSAWTRTSQWSPQPQDALGMIWQSQQPLYGTRVEVQWASSKTRGLIPEFGAIGVQLQGGSRLVLRARKGGPMLYYRAKF